MLFQTQITLLFTLDCYKQNKHVAFLYFFVFTTELMQTEMN